MLMETALPPTNRFATMPGMTIHEQTLRATLPVPPHEAELAAQNALCSGLLAAIARQDEAALAALYDATISRVYGLALRITRKPEAAEEVVADVYHQVWRKAATYDAARGRALTWLLTICYSRALDQLRRKDEAESHPDPETLRPALAENDSDPLDILQALENQSAIHAALQNLKPIQRQLIALAFFKGLSHQETADQSGLPLGSVKTHIRHALAQLRQALNADFDGAPS